MNQPGFTMNNSSRRRGVTAIEVLVSASLLVAAISCLTTLASQINKIGKGARHYQIAMHELANQLERLTSLSDSDRKIALQQMEISSDIRNALPKATLKGLEINDSDGKRIALSIDWDRGSPSVPITLVAWVNTENSQQQLDVAGAKEEAVRP